MRRQNPEFDALFRAAEVELNPVKRAALFIQMNDLVVGDGYMIPIIARTSVRAMNRRISAPLSGWDTDMASVPHWYTEL